MTPLREKMIRELELHRKSPTRSRPTSPRWPSWHSILRAFAERISVEEIRDFLHHLITVRKVAFSTCNRRLAGIQFFYHHVLGQEDFPSAFPASVPAGCRNRSAATRSPSSSSHHQPQAPRPADDRLRRWACAFGGWCICGRTFIPERMLIRVDQGKGHKDRYTLLSTRLLEELRAYWRGYRPQTVAVRRGTWRQAALGGHAQRVFDRGQGAAGSSTAMASIACGIPSPRT